MRGATYTGDPGPGLLKNARPYSFTPSEVAKDLFFYLTWSGHYFCSTDYFIDRDYHPDMLITYVLNGGFYLNYRGKEQILTSGQSFLIDCNEPHHYRAATELEFLFIHYNGANSKELSQYIMEQQGYVFEGERAQEIKERLTEIYKMAESDNIVLASDYSQKIYDLLMSFLRKTRKELDQENPVDNSIRYIRDNVGQKITLDELSNKVGLSKYYFSRLFKKETGYTPMEYIIATRIDRAKEMLNSTDLNISEISYEVGYENPGSFTNLFTKKVGYSPQRFRELDL